MEIRLDGQVALITGSDSGIGQGTAVRLAQSGANILVNYRSDREGAEKTAEMVRAAGREAEIVQADITDPAQIEAMFQRLDERFGQIDILVNNAGMGIGGELVDLPLEDYRKVMDTNLTGAFLCSQQAARRMLARGQGGRIIMITSVHEEAPGVGGGAYHISKGGMRNLMRALALELAPHGILVNSVAPGMIITPMNKRAAVDPEYVRQAEAQIPARRAGRPEDIANMVCFLASEQGSYCVGATFFVDGGWMLEWPPV